VMREGILEQFFKLISNQSSFELGERDGGLTAHASNWDTVVFTSGEPLVLKTFSVVHVPAWSRVSVRDILPTDRAVEILFDRCVGTTRLTGLFLDDGFCPIGILRRSMDGNCSQARRDIETSNGLPKLFNNPMIPGLKCC